MQIVIAQINSNLADLEKNLKKILEYYASAEAKSADLIILPELALTGYGIKDLGKNLNFIHEVKTHITNVLKFSKNINCAILLTCPFLENDKIFNAALFIYRGEILYKIFKSFLPNYDVFDEIRYFDAFHDMQQTINFKGHKIGVMICEDAWHEMIAERLAKENVSFFIVMSASPYNKEKHNTRKNQMSFLATKYSADIIYINCIGGQDHIVFDGGSFVIDKHGKYLLHPLYWQESAIDFFYCNTSSHIINQKNEKLLDNLRNGISEKEVTKQQPQLSYRCNQINKFQEIYLKDQSLILNNQLSAIIKKAIINVDEIHNVYQALMLSVRDYMSASKFSNAIIGLSGGADSALTSLIIADAIGASNLRAVFLPSRFTSQESRNDAEKLAAQLSCKFNIFDIESLCQQFKNNVFSNLFHDINLNDSSITLQNVQARIRALILMAISNQYNEMLFSTSNKSESAVGYTTLYGDMSGGFAPISDIYKTEVYELIKWRNNNIPLSAKVYKTNVIHESIIKKEPSAELMNNQKDSDNLPDYEILDQILYLLIECDILHPEKIANILNLDVRLISEIKHKLHSNEFKRRQAPIGPAISIRSLTLGRRYPLSSQYLAN